MSDPAQDTLSLLNEFWGEAVISYRVHPNGRISGVGRLVFHYTIWVDLTPWGYGERYCYQTLEGALRAQAQWSGEGDPDGWHKHPDSGRRRDPKTGEIWHESEDAERRFNREFREN